MKRISFRVAKALKDAGYPQDYKNAEDTYTNLNGGIWVKPTYIEVWLWLWREKKRVIDLMYSKCGMWQCVTDYDCQYHKDPEDAIVAAIEYLVDNDLIK